MNICYRNGVNRMARNYHQKIGGIALISRPNNPFIRNA